jgi:acetyl esterase/lipase
VKPVLPFVATAAAVVVLCLHAPHAEAADRYLDEVFPSVTVTSNIAYGQALDEFGVLETLRLDVYQPTGDTVTNRPVVIFVHGGGFTSGNKGNPDPVDYATRMAKRGFVSASINYRLWEGGYTQEQQAQVILDAKHDAQAAVRWFRANAATYDIDPDRISIAGYSAGSATALFTAYTPDDPGDSGNPGYPSDVSAVIDISGGMGNLADDVMDTGEPPVLIIHGTNDATSPYTNAQNIVAAAEAAGIPYELHTLQGANHSKFGPTYMADMAQWSGGFLYSYVVAGPVGGVTELAPARTAAPSGPSWWWGAAAALGATAAGAGLVARRPRRTGSA